MAFETVAPARRARTARPIVTVSQSGKVGFNIAALDRLGMGTEGRYRVVLSYDQKTERVGIDTGTGGKLLVMPGKWPTVSMRHFFRWIDCLPRRTMRFELRLDGEQHYIDLTEPI